MTVKVLTAKIALPRALPSAITFDIETVKVRGPWTWGDGTVNPYRWVTFMVGVARIEGAELCVDIIRSDREDLLVPFVEKWLTRFAKDTVTYHSKNGFDRLVMEGRFVHGRRRAAKSPGNWARFSVNCRLKMVPLRRWACLYPEARKDESQKDFYFGKLDGARTIFDPAIKMDLWAEHCARDVLDNIVSDVEGFDPAWVREVYERPMKFLR